MAWLRLSLAEAETENPHDLLHKDNSKQHPKYKNYAYLCPPNHILGCFTEGGACGGPQGGGDLIVKPYAWLLGEIFLFFLSRSHKVTWEKSQK